MLNNVVLLSEKLVTNEIAENISDRVNQLRHRIQSTENFAATVIVLT